MIWTKAFWKGAAERAVKSFAQGVVTAITGDAILSLWDLDFVQVAGVGGLMALLSLFTSLGNGEFTAGVQNDPSVVTHLRG